MLPNYVVTIYIFSKYHKCIFFQRGTEKYHHESDSEKNKKWGVAWYKDDYNGRDDIVIIEFMI